MPIEPHKDGDEIQVKWRYTGAPWKSAFGPSPLSVPPGTYPLVQGVDGRVQGSLRRYLGNLLLVDLGQTNDESVNPLGEQILADMDADHQNFIKDVIPFEISKGQTASRLRGFVLVHEKVFITLRPWQRDGDENWNYGSSHEWYGTCDSSYYDDRLFVSLLVYDEDRSDWYWQCLRTPGAYATYTGTPPYPTGDWNKPEDQSGGHAPLYLMVPETARVSVATQGRFLYLHSDTPDGYEGPGYQETHTRWPLPMTIWYDNEQDRELYPNWQGWHWERFGAHMPPEWSVDSHISQEVPEGGRSVIGRFKQGVRMRDFYRSRVGPLSDVDAIFSEGLAEQDDTYWEGQASCPYAGPANPFRSWLERQYRQFGHLEFFRTLLSLDTAEGSAGGYLFKEDLLKSRTQLQDAAGNYWGLLPPGTHTLVSDFRLMKATPRKDIELNTEIHEYGVNEETLALGGRYDYSADAIDREPGAVYALTHYRGLTVTACRSASDSEESPTQDAGVVALRWSGSKEFLPENFSPSNQVFTGNRLGGPLAFVQVGDYCFLVGGGPLTRLQRVGQYLDVVELSGGLDLVHRDAVCEVKGQILAVCRDGVYLIEPTTGNPSRLAALDRLLLDYWPQSRRLSVAYDARLDAVFIHSGDLGETVVLWMANQQVSFLADQNFLKVVSWPIEGAQRAVFVTARGRFLHPRVYEQEATEHWTRGEPPGGKSPDAFSTWGLPRYTLLGGSWTIYRPWTFQVESVRDGPPLGGVDTLEIGISDPWHGTTRLAARDDGGSFGQPWDFHWQGATLRFLLGEHKDTPLKLLATRNVGQILLVEKLPSEPEKRIQPGDVIVLGGIPLLVVGSTLEDAGGKLDPLLKRHVLDIAADLHRVEAMAPPAAEGGPLAPAEGPAGPGSGPPIPLCRVGVIDLAGFEQAYRVRGSPGGQPPGDWVQLARYGEDTQSPWEQGALPAGDQEYSPDDPSRMVVHLGATGHLLFPFFQTQVSDQNLELNQLLVGGTVTSSEITV